MHSGSPKIRCRASTSSSLNGRSHTVTPLTLPSAAMANPEKIEQLRTRAQREIDEGLLPSCQLALALDGEVIHHEAFGAATTDNRYVIFSSTKAIVASAVWLLIQSGDLDVAKTVADYIPEFGTFGKDVVTVEQVMLHTSGFPAAPMGPPAWSTREGRLA